MTKPRVSEELVGIYADLSLEDKATLDLPVVVELLAKDLQDAREELKKYGWDE